jgi:hypothetical protein
MSFVTVLVVLLCVLVPRNAGAQDPSKLCSASGPWLSDSCQKEFDRWVKKHKSWTDYMEAHRNRARDRDGRRVRIRPAPAAPAWVLNYCAKWGTLAEAASRVCDEYERVARYDYLTAPPKPVQPTTTVVLREKVISWKSWFLEHSRLDVAWMPVDTSNLRAYGPLGYHLVIATIDRVELFGPAGWLLVRMPDQRGVQVWRAGSTYGLGFHLGKAKLPFFNRPAEYSLTISRVWVGMLPKAMEAGNPNAGLSLAGLSIKIK